MKRTRINKKKDKKEIRKGRGKRKERGEKEE